MSASDFLRLPTGARILFVVMLWPAIWAAAQMAVVLAGDVVRQAKRPALSGSPRKAA